MKEAILSLEENYFFTCQHNHIDFNKSFLKPNEREKSRTVFEAKDKVKGQMVNWERKQVQATSQVLVQKAQGKHFVHLW